LGIKLLNENVERKYFIVQMMSGVTIQIEDISIDFDLKQYDLVVKRHSLICEILSSFIDIYYRLNIEQVKYYYEENILSIILNEKMVIKKSNNFDFPSFIIKGVNIIKSKIYYKGFLNMYICDVLSYKVEDFNYVIKIKLSVLTKEDILIKNKLININLFLIDTKEKLVNLVKNDHISLEIDYIKDPMILINNGFIINNMKPFSRDSLQYGYGSIRSSNYVNMILIDYINGTTVKEFNFWYRISLNYDDFLMYNKWIYGNIKYYKDEALKTGSSIGLEINYPNEVYKETLHPKTDMSLYKQPLLDVKADLKYLPVIRYSEDQNTGLYHGIVRETCKKFCGTFYYFEKESTTLLGYKTSLSFKTKTEAYNHLFNKQFKDPKDGYPQDMMVTPLKEYNRNELYKKRFTYEYVSSLPQKKRYLGLWYGLYSSEDSLDQDLCTKGKEFNIDILIFTDMIGGRQIVSKILDTRPRLTSFQHLVY